MFAEMVMRTLGGETCDISNLLIFVFASKTEMMIRTLGGETCDISHFCEHFHVRRDGNTNL